MKAQLTLQHRLQPQLNAQAPPFLPPMAEKIMEGLREGFTGSATVAPLADPPLLPGDFKGLGEKDRFRLPLHRVSVYTM
jgi:hypothetical protein